MLHHLKTIENVPATIAWIPLQNLPRYPRDTDGAFVNDGTPYGFFYRPNKVVVYNRVPKVETFVDNKHV